MPTVSAVPKITVRLSESWLTRLRKDSWLLFMIVKRYRLKSAKGKPHGAKSWRNQVQALRYLLPVESHGWCSEVRGLQRDPIRYIYIYERGFTEKWAYVIMEAENSPDRPSGSWRPWDAGNVSQSKFQNLRTWEADSVILTLRLRAGNLGFGGKLWSCWYKSWSPNVREPRVLVSKDRRRRVSSSRRAPFLCFFSPYLGP